MTTQLRTMQEIKVSNDFGQKYSDQIYNATLAAATNTPLTVPGGGIMGNMASYGGATANQVMAVIRVSEGDEVWFSVGADADVPAGASFAKDTSEIITGAQPMGKVVKVGDVLNFYSAGATTSVSVTFYAMNS